MMMKNGIRRRKEELGEVMGYLGSCDAGRNSSGV
jgi:hypothetical protein